MKPFFTWLRNVAEHAPLHMLDDVAETASAAAVRDLTQRLGELFPGLDGGHTAQRDMQQYVEVSVCPTTDPKKPFSVSALVGLEASIRKSNASFEFNRVLVDFTQTPTRLSILATPTLPFAMIPLTTTTTDTQMALQRLKRRRAEAKAKAAADAANADNKKAGGGGGERLRQWFTAIRRLGRSSSSSTTASLKAPHPVPPAHPPAPAPDPAADGTAAKRARTTTADTRTVAAALCQLQGPETPLAVKCVETRPGSASGAHYVEAIGYRTLRLDELTGFLSATAARFPGSNPDAFIDFDRKALIVKYQA